MRNEWRGAGDRKAAVPKKKSAAKKIPVKK
jgi:hypothetical protein